MRLIGNRKDIIAWVICVIWLVTNILVAWLLDSGWVAISNLGYCIFMVILIWLKNTNVKFNNWLERKL